jgi:hypothetical protein
LRFPPKADAIRFRHQLPANAALLAPTERPAVGHALEPANKATFPMSQRPAVATRRSVQVRRDVKSGRGSFYQRPPLARSRILDAGMIQLARFVKVFPSDAFRWLEAK